MAPDVDESHGTQWSVTLLVLNAADATVIGERRMAVGLAGVALGNGLVAVGNWLLGAKPILIGFELVGAVVLGVLAAAWWRRPEHFDPPTGTRFLAWLPTLMVVTGATLTAVGLQMVVTGLAG